MLRRSDSRRGDRVGANREDARRRDAEHEERAADVVFEGVLIPKDTRSAKLARNGITNEEEMAKFLTAVFADTLKGKIVLPKTNSESEGSSPILNGLEEKVRLGLPIGIQAMSSVKRPRGAKGKKP